MPQTDARVPLDSRPLPKRPRPHAVRSCHCFRPVQRNLSMSARPEILWLAAYDPFAGPLAWRPRFGTALELLVLEVVMIVFLGSQRSPASNADGRCERHGAASVPRLGCGRNLSAVFTWQVACRGAQVWQNRRKTAENPQKTGSRRTHAQTGQRPGQFHRSGDVAQARSTKARAPAAVGSRFTKLVKCHHPGDGSWRPRRDIRPDPDPQRCDCSRGRRRLPCDFLAVGARRAST